MGQLDPQYYNNPLDLLRRFVPTPLRACFCAGTLRVTVETNDFALFPTFPFDSSGRKDARQSLHWKLVRDFDVTAPLEEPLFVNSAPIRAVLMGPACLLGVDLERRQLVGFVGSAVDARTYREFLLPLLLRLSTETVSGHTVANIVEATEKPANV